MSSRDLFANFARMRREVDELFGEPVRTGRRRGVFTPNIDVSYMGDPPRAVVHAELPGIDPSEVTLEVHGRELLLAGRRLPPQAEGRLYQQVEIEHGTFRRVVQLGAEVDPDATKATYRDGILEVVLPLVSRQGTSRRVEIHSPEDSA